MKKFGIALALVIVAMGLLTVCFTKSEANTNEAEQRIIHKLSQNLCVQLAPGTIVQSEDTHGGFHGDGKTYIKISFPADESIQSALQSNHSWTALPFSETLHTLVYGKESDTESVGSYVTDQDNKLFFPKAKNGYYFFKDRFSGGKDINKDAEVLERHAFNFTIALYDSEAKVLYYYELDT